MPLLKNVPPPARVLEESLPQANEASNLKRFAKWVVEQEAQSEIERAPAKSERGAGGSSGR
jgi:hypothetical protein